MKTVDASTPGISMLLIGVAAVVCVVSLITLFGGMVDAQSNSGAGEMAAGASGFVFSIILFGLAAVITRLHSIDAHVKAYVLRELENEKVNS